MIITDMELNDNLNRYLELAANEDIIITRNGKQVAMLVNADKQHINEVVRSLRGILSSDIDLDHIKEERCNHRYG